MLNYRIRDLLFYYKKGVTLLNFICNGESVLKKMDHLSFRAHANDVNNTKTSQSSLLDWINKMTSDRER